MAIPIVGGLVGGGILGPLAAISGALASVAVVEGGATAFGLLLLMVLVFVAIIAFGGLALLSGLLNLPLGFLPLWGWLVGLFLLKMIIFRR